MSDSHQAPKRLIFKQQPKGWYCTSCVFLCQGFYRTKTINCVTVLFTLTHVLNGPPVHTQTVGPQSAEAFPQCLKSPRNCLNTNIKDVPLCRLCANQNKKRVEDKYNRRKRNNNRLFSHSKLWMCHNPNNCVFSNKQLLSPFCDHTLLQQQRCF